MRISLSSFVIVDCDTETSLLCAPRMRLYSPFVCIFVLRNLVQLCIRLLVHRAASLVAREGRRTFEPLVDVQRVQRIIQPLLALVSHTMRVFVLFIEEHARSRNQR